MKPTILAFVARYLPGFKSGGPVRSVANIVEELGDEFQFRVVTWDRDSFDTVPYPKIQVNKWNQLGQSLVFYSAPDYMCMSNVLRLLRETPHDVLYLNSFFNPKFTLLPLLTHRFRLVRRRPVILAPRGEFSKGAVEIKAWKKRPYISLTRFFGLYKEVIWQSSSEHEASDIRRELGRDAHEIKVVQNLPAPVVDSFDDSGTDLCRNGESLRIIYLSRVSPKKNLLFAIRVLSRVKVATTLNIYGVVDDERYWTLCKKEIDELPNHISVEYQGVVEHHKIASIFAVHDLFFLPTRGENFGHAILEALGTGTPALISDRTPWFDFDDSGVGWVRPLEDIDAFVEVIDEFATLNKNELLKQRERARAYAKRVLSNSGTVDRNRDLFLVAMETGDSK